MVLSCSDTKKSYGHYKREVFLSGVVSLYLYVKRNGTDDSMPRNTDTVEMMRFEDENSAPDLWPDYSIDA